MLESINILFSEVENFIISNYNLTNAILTTGHKGNLINANLKILIF